MTSKAERIRRGGLVCKDEHLTKQGAKTECDINTVLDRAKHGASLSHLLNYSGEYADFSHWTSDWYEETLNQLARGRSIFNDLPAELRANEFQNDVGVFFQKVNDPEYADRLEEIYPALAEPGRQFPDVMGGNTQLAEAIAQGVKAGLETQQDTSLPGEQTDSTPPEEGQV